MCYRMNMICVEPAVKRCINDTPLPPQGKQRMEIRRRSPALLAFDQWDVHVPSSTLFMPLTELGIDLSQHMCITAGADAMADIGRRRGLHALPADVLLAPGTDNQEIRKGI